MRTTLTGHQGALGLSLVVNVPPAGSAMICKLLFALSSGEILGGKNFEKFAVPFYKQIIGEVQLHNVPVIVHICGNANTIIDGLNTIGANALSFDSIVNMRLVKSKLNTRLMGNVNTQLLHTGEKEKIISITNNCIASGVDIISPACGLSMATPIDKLRTMTNYVKEGNYLL